MLVLSRHTSEEIYVGNDIKIMVVQILGDRVKLGITAPPDTRIDRREVAEAIVKDGLTRRK